MKVFEKSFFICILATLWLALTQINSVNCIVDGIDWVPYENRIEKAQELSKPIFLLVHRSWCGACKSLKAKLQDSEKFKEMSNSFVMVNVGDEDNLSDDYKSDGGYIPRLFFEDKNGQLKTDIFNENGNPRFRYFYPEPSQVINAMERALTLLNSTEDQSFSDSNYQTDEL